MSDVTMTFSAQDQEVAAACRRMAGDLAKVEAAGQRVAKSFGSAAGGGLLKAFGAFQAGRQLVGFAGSAMAEYAKRTNEGAMAQGRFNRAMDELRMVVGGGNSWLYNVGASMASFGARSTSGFQDFFATLMAGEGTNTSGGSTEYSKRRDAAIKQAGMDAAAFAEAQTDPWYAQQSAFIAANRSGGPNFGDKALQESYRHEDAMRLINAMNAAGRFADLKPPKDSGFSSTYDQTVDQEKKAYQQRMWQIEREEATKKDTVRQALNTAKQEDEIRMKRLKGYNHEADVAQQRLNTEQQIFKVMHDETMDLNDRIAESYRLQQVGDAMIQQMEQMPIGRIKGNVSLGDGLNSSANFARTFYGIQNGGGSDSKANEQKVILKDISTSLKSIDRKIGNGAVYA